MPSKVIIDCVKALYPEAKKIAGNCPIFDTAQVGLETGWMAKKVGQFNLGGMKAGPHWTGKKVLWPTTEIAKNKTELAQLQKSLPKITKITPIKNGAFHIDCEDWFMDFDSIQDYLEHHLALLKGANFAPAISFAKDPNTGVIDPIKYVTALQDKKICKLSYATAPNYVAQMTPIIKEVQQIVKQLNL